MLQQLFYVTRGEMYMCVREVRGMTGPGTRALARAQVIPLLSLTLVCLLHSHHVPSLVLGIACLKQIHSPIPVPMSVHSTTAIGSTVFRRRVRWWSVSIL